MKNCWKRNTVLAHHGIHLKILAFRVLNLQYMLQKLLEIPRSRNCKFGHSAHMAWHQRNPYRIHDYRDCPQHFCTDYRALNYCSKYFKELDNDPWSIVPVLHINQWPIAMMDWSQYCHKRRSIIYASFDLINCERMVITSRVLRRSRSTEKSFIYSSDFYEWA